MPRSGPRRPTLTFRISDAGLSELAKLSTRYGVKRSEVVRRLITFGLARPKEALGEPPAAESGR